MNARIGPRLLLILLLAHVFTTCADPASEPEPRPAAWAQAVPGVELGNLHLMGTDIYRSAQPEEDQWTAVEALGIRTVLNLRSQHEDQAAGRKLDLLHVPMKAGRIRDEEVAAALRIVRDAERPLLIHCRHGSDRTGCICALARILFEGWSREDAITEMMDGGYGFHFFWFPNIPDYVREVDLEHLRTLMDVPEESTR